MSSIRGPALLGILVVLHATSVPAQQRLFPDVRSFELPEASPRVHGLVGRVLSASRGDSRFGQEQEGEVILGENFPLVVLKGGHHPIVLGFGSQVYGRFSLTDPKSALISTDWVVGINTTAVLAPWAVTLELYHESSHLGDEYGDRFPDDRLKLPAAAGSLGVDYHGKSRRFLGGQVRPVAGLFTEAGAATRWRVSTS